MDTILKIKRLKGKQLGKVERRILWYLRGGKLEPQEFKEFSKITMETAVNKSRGREIFKYMLIEDPKLDQIAKEVYSMDILALNESLDFGGGGRPSTQAIWMMIERCKPSPSQISSTSRALNTLESYGLVQFRYISREKTWKLTDLGKAVVNAYQNEFREEKKIRWDTERVNRWLQPLLEKRRERIRRAKERKREKRRQSWGEIDKIFESAKEAFNLD